MTNRLTDVQLLAALEESLPPATPKTQKSQAEDPNDFCRERNFLDVDLNDEEIEQRVALSDMQRRLKQHLIRKERDTGLHR